MVGLKNKRKTPTHPPCPPGSLGTCFKWALYNDGRWFYTLGSSSVSWSGCCGHLEPVPPSRAHSFILCTTEQEEEGLLFCHAAGRDARFPNTTPHSHPTPLGITPRTTSPVHAFRSSSCPGLHLTSPQLLCHLISHPFVSTHIFPLTSAVMSPCLKLLLHLSHNISRMGGQLIVHTDSKMVTAPGDLR